MNSVSKNVRVVNVFAIQQFSSFLVDISLDIACKDVKVVQIAQVEQLFQVWNLICMYNELFKGQTRVLMTQKYKQWRQQRSRYSWCAFLASILSLNIQTLF